MVRVPTPYEKSDDSPVVALKFTRGSNNSRRATLQVLVYPSGEVCVQVEDRVGGGEQWLDADALMTLGQEMCRVAADMMAREGGEDECLPGSEGR